MRGPQFNICFHGIGNPERQLEPGEEAYWITPQLFSEVLDEVVGREDVALSFDDGNRSDVTHGLPGLSERGLVATFFALAGRLEQPGSLGEVELRALRAAGMTVGSHGFDHRPWRHLDEDQQRREFVEARRLLVEASGGAVDEAALPLGRYDRQVLGRLRAEGYDHVYSSDRAPARRSSWLQPRYSIRAGDSGATVRAILLRPDGVHRTLQRARMTVKRWR
ncbi:polysaccharide deacetylase family protein [Microlunatus capsulatus]|uniref:Peptidoglycan/xylan/chitin deacetylase (PgdA/CDA1 family) n=1 Tax=Microlunatus capsulatus TaxID=99117 RepID=A0ABS4ZBX6_9ACTN|nr:polysaccharide deacetylase family protein [Microlunatus capsulatus]MBP2418561.1 peptidoglycan/xylan/chitin deacetylase (PgdA/CDA1 family) [Microlunatus capsulatus]